MAAGMPAASTGSSHNQLEPQPAMAQTISQRTGQTQPQTSTYKSMEGSRRCTVTITNGSKKVLNWLAKLPYDVVMVQEHHKKYKKQFYTSLVEKHLC
eukprot:10632047-Karenia_brevis.AAC.1